MKRKSNGSIKIPYGGEVEVPPGVCLRATQGSSPAVANLIADDAKIVLLNRAGSAEAGHPQYTVRGDLLECDRKGKRLIGPFKAVPESNHLLLVPLGA